MPEAEEHASIAMEMLSGVRIISPNAFITAEMINAAPADPYSASRIYRAWVDEIPIVDKQLIRDVDKQLIRDFESLYGHIEPSLLEEPPQKPQHTPIPGVLYGHGRFSKYQRERAQRHVFFKLVPNTPNWRLSYYGRDVAHIKNQFEVLDAYIKAYIKQPDRMDIIGDIIIVLYHVNLDFTRRINAKFPELHEAVRRMRDMGTEPEWLNQRLVPPVSAYVPLVSDADYTKISYYPTVKALIKGKRSETTPGRFLKKAYPTLADKEIKRLAELHLLEYAEPEVKIARSESECIRAVAEGPSESCMANGFHHNSTWYRGHVHPAAVYGYADDNPEWDTDIEILYAEDSKGRIKSRLICNAKTKQCARIYGEALRFKKAIEKLGYAQVAGALAGCRIRLIENEEGDGYILPYVDAGVGPGGGSLNFAPHDSGETHLMLLQEEGYGARSTYAGYENKGITVSLEDDYDEDMFTCDSCGHRYDTDEATVTFEDDTVCEHCLSGQYVVAYVNALRREDYVRELSTVFCVSDGETYLKSIAEECGVEMCQESGEYHFRDNLLNTPDGYMHPSHCTTLDVSYAGYDHAAITRTLITHDGRTIYEFAAEIRDGVIYHHNDVIPDETPDEEERLSSKPQQTAYI